MRISSAKNVPQGGGASTRRRPPSAERLGKIWDFMLKDSQARKAICNLRDDGLDLQAIPPEPWTIVGMVASVALLPDRLASTKLYRAKDLGKYWPLVRFIRRRAEECEDPYRQIRVTSTEEMSLDTGEIPHAASKLREVADFLNRFLSWNWTVRERNPRLFTIAMIRWSFRSKTTSRSPHDRELTELLDSAFRAAGIEKGFQMEPVALRQLEIREKKGRMKQHKKAWREKALSNQNVVMYFR